MEDENFKKYCLENFDTDKDGKISRREAELVKEINGNPDDLDFYFTSTKGIEYFTNLETFSCPYSEDVKTIDLHYNTKITVIPEYAFTGGMELEKFILPPNVSSVGSGAFSYCPKLAGFHGKPVSEDNRCLILDGKLVGFAYAGLTTYTIPDGVTAIGAEVFATFATGAAVDDYGKCELTEIRIPDSVTSIEGEFHGLPNLKAIYSRFSTADNRCLVMDGKLLAFAPAGLKTYSIPDGVKTITSVFCECEELTGITIPDGVETIDASAFFRSGLTSVTIPGSVTRIGNYAFYCYGLESVTVEATTPPAFGKGVFSIISGHENNFAINVPKASVDTYKTADGWKDYAEYIKGI